MPADRTRAVRSLVLAAFSLSLMALFARLAGSRVPSIEIVFVRSVITLVLTLALMWRVRLANWRGQRQSLLLLRGVLGFGALSGFYYSVTHLPLAEATVIHFVNPIFTAVLASLFLGERATPRLWAAVGLGLTGMLLITRPAVLFADGPSNLPALALFAALSAAFLTSCAHVLVRRLAAEEHELVIMLCYPLVTAPLAMVATVPVWVWPSAWDWLLLAAVGISAQVGQIHITRGFKYIQAASAGVILYLQIVFAIFWGLMVLGEWPGVWTIGGSLLVLAGTVVASRRPSQSASRSEGSASGAA